MQLQDQGISTETGTAYLRSNIKRGTKLVKEALAGRAEVSSAKINDLDGGIMVLARQQDVFRFQVSVHKALAVQEGQELNEAAHQLGSLLLAVVFLCNTQNGMFAGGGQLGCI